LELKNKLDVKTQSPDFWSNRNEAKEVQTKLKSVNSDIERIKAIDSCLEEIETILALLEDAKDHGLEKELEHKFNLFLSFLDREEFNLMFSGKYDQSDAIVTLHSGAGGTEACDWVSMLLRMYLMWAEKKGFKTSIVDMQPGDEAGIKNVTFEAAGN